MSRVAMLSRAKAEHTPPARLMAEGLVARGHEVDFYSLSNPRELWSPGRPEVNYIELAMPSKLLAPYPLNEIEREVRWGRSFLAATAPGGYDLWYAHDPMPIPWIRRAALRSRRPWVFHCHDLVLKGEASRLAVPFQRYEQRFARTAALVICPEDNRADVLFEADRLRSRPLVVRNAPAVRPLRSSAYLRAWLSSKGRGDETVFLYQGGLSDAPSFRALVDSVRQWPSGDLVLLGWGGGADNLMRRAEDHGVATRVHLHAPVNHSQLWEVVCSADVGIVLSEGGGINSRYCAPNKLGDFVMAGVPIMYRACSGANQIADGKNIGVRVDDPDEDGWASAAAAADLMARDPNARARVRRFAEDEFNHPRESKDALDLLERILASI